MRSLYECIVDESTSPNWVPAVEDFLKKVKKYVDLTKPHTKAMVLLNTVINSAQCLYV